MLISAAYRAEQRRLHETTEYGVASLQFAPIVSNLIDSLEVNTVLDYGAGRGNLLQGMKTRPPQRTVEIELYDPAVPAISMPPGPAELVTCIDVLEHIEPELLANVLDDLHRLAGAYVFLTVHTGPAKKTLSDGRNAHLTQQPASWWLPRLLERWELMEAKKIGPGFIFIGATRLRLEIAR
jgi:2-polyprenyl-3-methyl-5-hydroxy-6-metoxy-1,4-benzoquinol methylase